MERVKRVLKALAFPHTAVVVALVPVAAAMLGYTFVFEEADSIRAIVSYVVSFYALVVLCLKAPAAVRYARRVRNTDTRIGRYVNDVHYRMKLSLSRAALMNLLYAALQLFLGIYYCSVWFYALAGYYFLLGIMRFFLLKETLQKLPGEDIFIELLHYRLCGVLLVPMNIALGIIVIYIVWLGRSFTHHYIVTIALAAYTFWLMGTAIVNVIKYRRYKSPVMSAAKVITLASALVSMLALETSMLEAFGNAGDVLFRRIMTASTGTAVCIIILGIASYMIVYSTREINRLKGESLNGTQKSE